MFFKSIDILSPEISLYNNNRKRHSSFIGGFLTLILFLYSLFIIIQHSAFTSFPDKYSLKIYRNFDTYLKFQYFNDTESGLFHFFYIYNGNDIDSEELIKFKSIKNGILRIYMINILNPHEYDSSNLQNYDHWLYDTCHNYVIEEDKKYDYSYSFCIQYYYNHIHKRYYSITDKANFKWPFFKEAFSIAENSYFITLIERCANNSYINNILGQCYSEERINSYFEMFNNIFISFIDNTFEINDKKEPIKTYSHQIHNALKINEKFFSFHEMEFTRFNYEENKIFREQYKKNSFIFEEDRISKIYKDEKNKILTAFSFRFKKYLNEFRKQENKLFYLFRILSINIISVYSILYIINLFFNEIIQTNNFILYLNDKDSLIYKHINYDKSKLFSLRSNLNSNGTNDNYGQFSSFGNLKTNNMSNNIFTTYNRDNISKFNKKSEDFVEKDDNNYSKKNENIFFINNGTFMDGNINNNKNLHLNFNIFEKTKSMKFDRKKSKLDDLENNNNRIHSYRKRRKEKGTTIFKSLILRNMNEKQSENYSPRNEETFDNCSKQKIMNNSSICLFKDINNQNNLNLNTKKNNAHKKELTPPKKDKKHNQFTPNNQYLTNQLDIISKNKESKNDLINYHENNKKFSVSTKTHMNSYIIDKEKNRLNISSININNFKSQEKIKIPTKKFLEPIRHPNRRNSLTNEIININDSNSQISISKKVREYYLKNNQLNKMKGNKLNKEKTRQEQRDFIKKKKTDINNSLNVHFSLNNNNNNTKLLNVEKYIIFTPKICWNYLCLCRDNDNNGIRAMSNFRKKLLSEEYIYIMHLSLLIYKRKFGCKSILDKNGILDELYYDY